MPRLDSDKFLNELNRLYDHAKERSVFVTFKTSNLRAKRKDRRSGEGELHCLVRATDGGKRKISTLVPKQRLEEFKSSFNVILRAKMTSLKKRDRKKQDTKTKK
jgi:signal recognition particle subunit SRP14